MHIDDFICTNLFLSSFLSFCMHIDDFICMNSFLLTPYLPMSAHIIFIILFLRLLCFYFVRLLLSLPLSLVLFLSHSLSLSLSPFLFSFTYPFFSLASFLPLTSSSIWQYIFLQILFQSLLCISWRACWMLGYSVYCPSGYVLPGLEVRTLSSF